MLAEFQSRKAHCVQVKEKDMLRILFFITIAITGYLLGWTLVNIDHSNENISLGKYLLGNGFTTKEKAFFQTCRPRSWDYLVQFGLLKIQIFNKKKNDYSFFFSGIYFSLCWYSFYL
jgi:hypothetical protein